ncbi:Protein of unknown function [Chitinophaga jiangningensis]|uniref:DUF3667 domain-containing protein n=1 Tax=Chitinophaga jiangningensis TaxID=1419482 RepID=A0A1M6YR82_9BACT|nr:DUF3667 domain-containing protein [Chitinophaga jiangningensis]SHL20831.1 Protein of unknown function [Chitinophaga jiangningensis]
MRTQPLREDKHCLNCGYEVPERYCTHCGQENTVQHETFGHLVKHFVADIFHYDSQFLITLKYLMIRPGFLTREYMAGRRVRYVNPIKLYVFVSFVFFLTAFGVLSKNWDRDIEIEEDPAPKKEKQEFTTRIIAEGDTVHGYRYHAAPVSDTSHNNLKRDSILTTEKTKGTEQPIMAHTHDSASSDSATDHPAIATGHGHEKPLFSLAGTETKSYDDEQAKLPPAQRDNKYYANLKRRTLFVRDFVKGRIPNQEAVRELMWEYFKHNAPKVMFLLLPLAALLMKWMYRKQKKWVYADFAIFALHFHSFMFILYLLAVIIMSIFPGANGITWANWLIFGYLVVALYNNYGQSWRRSIWKASLLWISYVLMVLGVMTIVMGFLVALIL